MEVWRLSSKRLAASTFFVRGSPELPLPMTTNNQPRRYTGISGGCAGREAGRKQKTQSSKTEFHHKNRIYRKQKAAQQTTLRKFQERKFFFLTIYLYLCNRLFELCKALYIIVEDRSPNHYLLHFITHKAIESQSFEPK